MADNKDDHVIPVGAILNWIDYSDENREELAKLVQFLDRSENAKRFMRPVDWDIITKVSLFVGDITRLKVHGIVSTTLESGACGLAVSKAAGPELSKELEALKGCETGEAKTTKGYNLPAKYVVHTAGPRGDDPSQLTKCYDNCLAEMSKHGMKSLAFSSISVGAFGYHPEEAARVALLRVRKFLENLKRIAKLGDINRIIFCLSDETFAAVYKTWMQIYFPCGSEVEYVAWLTEKKERELEPLDGFIQITTTEPDMVTFDDDPKKRRAKMPCGHVMGTESMTTYCVKFLSKGQSVECPVLSCDATWQYFLVRHVASLTRRQMQEFERRISQSYLERKEGKRRCPQCHVMCSRKDTTDPCVKCAICTAKTKQKFLFCWKCLGVWKGGNGCGNRGCVDERLRVLAKCPIKRILKRFDAPSVRGCPNCGLLIEYLRECTHMRCTGCSYCFCFLCLKGGAKFKRDLACRPFTSDCTIAPRQTSLPGM